RQQKQLQAPNRSAPNGFGRGRRSPTRNAFRLAASFFDRHRARLGLAALGAFPPGPSTWPLYRVVGLIRLCGGAVVALRWRGSFDRPGRRGFADGVGVGRHAVRLGHRDSPGRPGAPRLARNCNAVTISGASMVTSPAPMVTTTSPGAAVAATTSAIDEKSGRYCTGTLTYSATLAPLTPAIGCSRAP